MRSFKEQYLTEASTLSKLGLSSKSVNTIHKYTKDLHHELKYIEVTGKKQAIEQVDFDNGILAVAGPDDYIFVRKYHSGAYYSVLTPTYPPLTPFEVPNKKELAKFLTPFNKPGVRWYMLSGDPSSTKDWMYGLASGRASQEKQYRGRGAHEFREDPYQRHPDNWLYRDTVVHHLIPSFLRVAPNRIKRGIADGKEQLSKAIDENNPEQIEKLTKQILFAVNLVNQIESFDIKTDDINKLNNRTQDSLNRLYQQTRASVQHNISDEEEEEKLKSPADARQGLSVLLRMLTKIENYDVERSLEFGMDVEPSTTKAKSALRGLR